MIFEVAKVVRLPSGQTGNQERIVQADSLAIVLEALAETNLENVEKLRIEVSSIADILVIPSVPVPPP